MERIPTYYRGLRNVYFIWHGEWADPEIQYLGKRINFYIVEDYFSELYKEETGKNEIDDNAFSRYCRRHEKDIKWFIKSVNVI